MHLAGKQIKDYTIDQPLLDTPDGHLLRAHKSNGQQVCVLMIDKKNLDQQLFVAYNNLLLENKSRVHPQYIEPIQSTNNIYLVLEKVDKIEGTGNEYKLILSSLVWLYRKVGEFKVEEDELFVAAGNRVVYLPFYKRINTSSKFYAQFHNKSVLGQVFARTTPLNKNRALEIFIQNIDTPNAEQAIAALIESESHPKPSLQPTGGQAGKFEFKPNYPSIQQTGGQVGKTQFKSNYNYPNLESTGEQELKEDEQILQLMSQAKVNAEMKKQAGDIFKRQSVRRFEEESDKEMTNIMEHAKSSMVMLSKNNVGKSQQFKTKMQVKMSAAKLQGDQFDVYFRSYYESLRFLKRAIKKILEYYRSGFAGVVSSYLLATVLTLRKVYMIRDLEEGIDVFELQIQMKHVRVGKYVAILKGELKSETRMIVELRNIIENCQMPVKTYNILSPYLQEDLSVINFEGLQSFTFFFLSALMKGRELGKVHFMYMIEAMYILLNRSYDIVFLESEFPGVWEQQHFDQMLVLIGGMLPGWSLGEAGK